MSFTVEDIKANAEYYIRANISDSDALAIVNRGMEQLGAMGYIYAETTIEDAVAMTFYALPEDNLGVLFVTDDNDGLYYRWQYEAGEIRFAEAGTYKVSARRMHPVVDTVAEDIDLNRMYRPALTCYLEGHVKLKDDDASHDGHRLMQEYERIAIRAFNTLIRGRKPTQVRTFRHA